ncbi:hypothetical protein TMM008_04190 [Pseudomonas sp. 008]|nr:hypothetical protein TMM008_04190 [Pseudomonas sp. 008]
MVPAGFAVLLSDEHGITLDSRLPSQHDAYTQSGLVVGARWEKKSAMQLRILRNAHAA